MANPDYTPLRYDWAPVTRGDTFDAINFSDSSADTDLSRVRCKIVDADGSTKITLDSSGTGATITTATAGSWLFTLGPIAAATTEGLTAGLYAYDIETTDASGNVRTEFNGGWEILAQITDA